MNQDTNCEERSEIARRIYPAMCERFPHQYVTLVCPPDGAQKRPSPPDTRPAPQ
jgi:hypothetical protein